MTDRPRPRRSAATLYVLATVGAAALAVLALMIVTAQPQDREQAPTTPGTDPVPTSAAATRTGDEPFGSETVETRLVRVVDGRTLVLEAEGSLGTSGEVTVALAGLDAPADGECGSEDSAESLARSLPEGSTALVSRDADRPRDEDGHELVLVGNGGLDDIGETQLAAGMVRPDQGPDHRWSADYAAAADRARTDGIGLWRSCPGFAQG